MYKNLTQFTASDEPQASWSLPHCYNYTHILSQGHPSRSQTKKSSHRQRAFFRPIPRIYLKDLSCEGWGGDMCYFRQLCCFITSSNSFYHIRNIKSIKKFFTTKSCVCFIKQDFIGLKNYAHMPYPCSHFYFDIKFGDRLYSKEKRRAWPLLFWI